MSVKIKTNDIITWNNNFLKYTYLFYGMCICLGCVHHSMGGDQNTGSTPWDSGIKLRSSGLIASAFAHWVNSQAPQNKS